MTAKKKRFGTLSVVGEGISSVLRNADNNADGLNIEQLPLSRIEPDPENPRRLGIDREALLRYTRGELPPRDLAANWVALQELAQSIREIGVQQPIKCYRYGDRFRIAFGERRFLASLLAGRDTIPAWILDERPRLLRRVQYAENVLRENLSPWERVTNVEALLREYQSTEGKSLASRGLAEVLGVSHTQANAYLSIIKGPEEVRNWLKEGQLTTIDSAAALARIPNSEQRDEAFRALARGEPIREAVQAAKSPKTDRNKSEPKTPTPPHENSTAKISNRGRTAVYVHLGRTTSPKVVRRMIEILGGRVPDIDWNDLGAVSREWSHVLRALERELTQ